MYIVNMYGLVVVFCIITMLGWGSWANTLKMTTKKWEFPLYYWDCLIGFVLTTLVFGFTFGSSGTEGRSFIADLTQADTFALTSAFIAGIIFNLSNILIVAATAIAGMSVAFPIAVGFALIIIAILVDTAAYKKLLQKKKGDQKKGIIISIISGILMGFFYNTQISKYFNL